MARVVLGVTGSVAAVRAPALYQSLVAAGHVVRVVATEAAVRFFDPLAVERCEGPEEGGGAHGPVYRDSDEWGEGLYRRGDPVPHIEFRRWADLLVVAPLDANTLGKFALGLSDNFLTCLFRAWDFGRPVVLAPAMNTLMWESPVTLRHLRQLLEDHGRGAPVGAIGSLEGAPEAFARYAPNLVLVAPQAKRLACGDVGLGAMAEVEAVAEAVRAWGSPSPTIG